MQITLREQLPKRLELTELEYEIQRMEADLAYHRKKCRIFEEALEKQHQVLADMRREDQL